MRLAVLVSHPIQYHAPLFRELARRLDICVFFAHRATPEQQGAAGFGTSFEWDVDLLGGYAHEFLRNVAPDPGSHHFSGCDTPEIAAKLDDGSFGALLVMGWHLKSYWQGVWAARRRGMRVLARGDSHLDTPRHAIKRLVKGAAYPVLLRAFDAALYVGQRNRAYYEYYHYPAARLFASPHCVDTERFAAGATAAARAELRGRTGLGPNEKVALFAGKLIAFKRPLDLIDAAAKLRAHGSPVHVFLAGSGPLEAEIRTRAAAAETPLHALGFQNQTRMPAIYAAADVLVLPGEETWGLVANEAIACGVPIIVSDAVGCAPDLATDSRVGRTFPAGDVDALADALFVTFTSRPSLEAIRRVSNRHSLGAAADGIEAALMARESRRL